MQSFHFPMHFPFRDRRWWNIIICVLKLKFTESPQRRGAWVIYVSATDTACWCFYTPATLLLWDTEICFWQKIFLTQKSESSVVQREESHSDKWANRKQTLGSSRTSLMRALFKFGWRNACVSALLCVFAWLWVCVCACVSWVSEAVKSSLKSPNLSKLASRMTPPHNYIHPHCAARIPTTYVCVCVSACVCGVCLDNGNTSFLA